MGGVGGAGGEADHLPPLLGAGRASSEVAALAPAGRTGLALQAPAPVGRQQRCHMQHASLHADPRQPQRAPLLQLSGRSLLGLTTRDPRWPLRTRPAGTGSRELPWLALFGYLHLPGVLLCKLESWEIPPWRLHGGNCSQAPPAKDPLPLMGRKSAYS